MALFNAHFFRIIAPFSKTVIATLLMQTIPSTLNATYWLHFGLTVLSWFIPFLFDWRLVLCAYSIVLLQFVIFGGCLMNRGHALNDAENATAKTDAVGVGLFRTELLYLNSRIVPTVDEQAAEYANILVSHIPTRPAT
jgi:hypothetical protein